VKKGCIALGRGEILLKKTDWGARESEDKVSKRRKEVKETGTQKYCGGDRRLADDGKRDQENIHFPVVSLALK